VACNDSSYSCALPHSGGALSTAERCLPATVPTCCAVVGCDVVLRLCGGVGRNVGRIAIGCLPDRGERSRMEVVGGIDGGLVGTIVCTPQSQCRLLHTLKRELSEEARLGCGERAAPPTARPDNQQMGWIASAARALLSARDICVFALDDASCGSARLETNLRDRDGRLWAGPPAPLPQTGIGQRQAWASLPQTDDLARGGPRCGGFGSLTLGPLPASLPHSAICYSRTWRHRLPRTGPASSTCRPVHCI
jgi:hypothetical protein